MTATRWAMIALAIGTSCRQAGEFIVEFDRAPPARGTALIYALPDESGPCECGACAAKCDDDCVRVDDGARVDADALEAASLAPPPGSWRLIVDFFDDTDDLLTHSADGAMALDSNGTASGTIVLTLRDCPR
jgi:hypothetical protein